MAQTQISDVVVPAEFTAYQVENSLVYRFIVVRELSCLSSSCGYKAMGESIDLKLFKESRSETGLELCGCDGGHS
jgi:hypothetical protein